MSIRIVEYLRLGLGTLCARTGDGVPSETDLSARSYAFSPPRPSSRSTVACASCGAREGRCGGEVASTRSRLACAIANSQTLREASAHSAVQSRTLERQPFGTAPIFGFSMSLAV